MTDKCMCGDYEGTNDDCERCRLISRLHADEAVLVAVYEFILAVREKMQSMGMVVQERLTDLRTTPFGDPGDPDGKDYA